MRRPDAAADRLGAALNRRNPESVMKLLGQMLEAARRTSFERSASAAAKEQQALETALKEQPEAKERLGRAIAVAEGDIALAKFVEVSGRRMARPDPKGLTLAGLTVPGRTGAAPATVVFLDAEGRAIEGAPEVPVDEDGQVTSVLGEREVAALTKALGARAEARLGLRIGERVVATTNRPLAIRPGVVLQFSLDPKRG